MTSILIQTYLSDSFQLEITDPWRGDDTVQPGRIRGNPEGVCDCLHNTAQLRCGRMSGGCVDLDVDLSG